MNYLEIVSQALKGRSVNSAAKQWGVPQSTLDKYVKGIRLPDYLTAKKIADDAGIDYGVMLTTLALEEENRRSYNSGRADVAQLVEQLIRNQ